VHAWLPARPLPPTWIVSSRVAYGIWSANPLGASNKGYNRLKVKQINSVFINSALTWSEESIFYNKSKVEHNDNLSSFKIILLEKKFIRVLAKKYFML
jgi:hypothetical protein